jgi:hypothetical protein
MINNKIDKLEGALTYTIGATGMSLPMLLKFGTDVLTFLTALGGFILVCWRLQYDYRKRKETKDDSEA